MTNPKWAINGVILPRNPTSFALNHDTSNATYVKMADGSQRRITPPNLLTAAKVQMEWMFADSRIQNAILSKINQAILAASSSAALSKIYLDGELPAVELWAYFESPSVTYSGHSINGGNGGAAGSSPDLVVDTRIGQGGVRKDIIIEGRTDEPYLHSHSPVPGGQNTVNLMPYTDTMSGAGWTRNAFSYGTGGPGGAVDLEYTIPATQNDAYIQSAPAAVTPNGTYTFSVWCNPSVCSSGGLWLLLFDYTNGSIGSQLASLVPTGSDRRYSLTFAAPATCTRMVALLRENVGVGTIPPGSVVKFSQPQLERGNAASSYSANNSSAPGFQSSDVTGWFGGPTGNNTIDGLPNWNAQPWFQVASTSAALAFSNLGTAPWNPTIRLNGPFNNGLSITAAYQDVDGTGQGVIFTYTGPNVNSGDYLLFDTKKLRLKSSVAGAVNEIYSFSVQTVANGVPFPYWPPAPPGTFNVNVTLAGGTASTSVDYSNNGTETFRYWA